MGTASFGTLRSFSRSRVPVRAGHRVSSEKTGSSSVAERYGVLLDASRAMAASLSIPALCETIWAHLSEVIAADGFYVSLYDRAQDEARIVFYVDEGRPAQADVSYRGSASRVISEGRPLIVSDDLESSSVMLLGENDSRVTRSAISAPLRADGEVLGAISAQCYEPGCYGPEDLELLEAIAEVAAVAVVNAHHVEDLRQRAAEAGKIEEIGRALAASLDTEDVLTRVTNAVRDLIAADGSSVWLLEGREARVAAAGGGISLPIGLRWDLTGPLYDKLVGAREVAWIDDLAASPLVPEHLRSELRAGSGIAVPLVVGGGVAGFLTAGSRNTDAFGDDAARILSRLASQAAVALQNAQLHASVRALSLTDQLTGLANRRHMDIHLRREVAAAYRGRQVSLVLFDLDDFKKFNDTLGHLAGDDILRAFAGVLQDNNRAMNLVARLGGDEFVTILTDSSPEGVDTYLDRIRAGMAADPVLRESGVTFSAGVAFYDTAEMESGQDLVQRADEALYAHKATRDR